MSVSPQPVAGVHFHWPHFWVGVLYSWGLCRTCAYCHNLYEFIYSFICHVCLENTVCCCYQPPLAFAIFPPSFFSKIFEPGEDGCSIFTLFWIDHATVWNFLLINQLKFSKLIPIDRNKQLLWRGLKINDFFFKETGGSILENMFYMANNLYVCQWLEEN